MKRKHQWLLVGGICASLSGLAKADDSAMSQELERLKHRIEELEQQVRTLQKAATPAPATNQPGAGQPLQDLEAKIKSLERNRELDREAAADAKARQPIITVGAEGFALSSASGDFALQLRGVLQVDSRTFFDDGGINGNDGFLLRRARPILQGTVYRDFDFVFVPDFGGTSAPQIFDAYLNYRFRPELQFQIGKFKSPVGLELLQADVDTLFNERALATDLTPNRDLGIELHGDVLDGRLSYAAAFLNGVGDSRNSSNFDFDDSRAFAGRLFLQPFKRSSATALQAFGFGVTGSYERMRGTNVAGLPSTTGGSLPGYTTDGLQQFFAYNPASNAVVVADGEHWRLSPQGYYYFGPFGLMGEYIISNQRVTRTVTAPQTSASLANTAWEITTSWVLTGEDAAYSGHVTPRNPFDPMIGQWGALQLAARYAQLDIDEAAFPLFANPQTSAHSAAAWSVGLNWYLNRNVEVKTSFSHTDFRGGGAGAANAPGSVTRQDENVLFTRFQLGF